MQEKMHLLDENEVWDLVDLHKDKLVVGSK